MAIEKINWLNQMEKALFEEKNNDLKMFKTDMVNLLSYAYLDFELIYQDFCKEKNHPYENDAFYCFQEIFAYFSINHNILIYDMYSTYKLFCQFAGTESLDKLKFRILANHLTDSQIIDDIELIAQSRKLIDPFHYYSLCLSFCYLILLRRIVLTERHYNILVGLFNRKIDQIPTYNEFYEKTFKQH